MGTVNGRGYDGQQLSEFFSDFYLFIKLTSCSDAKMLGSGDFSADDRRQTIAVPLAHACGIIKPLGMHGLNRVQFGP